MVLFQKEYIKPIEEGIREAAESGILAGYPVIDFKSNFGRWFLP